MENVLFLVLAPVVTLVLAALIAYFGYRALKNSGKTPNGGASKIILVVLSALLIWFLLYWVAYIVLFIFIPVVIFIVGFGLIAWGVIYFVLRHKNKGAQSTSPSDGSAPLI